MNDERTIEIFQNLIHLLEVSVVLGIAVVVYITKKYSKNINEKLEKKIAEDDRQNLS